MFLSILYTLIKILLIYYTLIFIYYKYKLYHFNGTLALPIFGNLYKKKAFRFIHFINDYPLYNNRGNLILQNLLFPSIGYLDATELIVL